MKTNNPAIALACDQADEVCELTPPSNTEVAGWLVDGALRKALHEAATSLETIGRLAGLCEDMLEDSEVRAYANNRARVARGALAALSQTSKEKQ